MLVDSHCHLDFPDFASELDAVVARARAAGLGRIVTICTRVRKFAQVLAVAEKFPEIFCSVGTHPHNAHEELDIDTNALIALTKNPKVVAIGEAGLDYHYNNSPRDAQAQGLRQHIAASRETGLPLVIHSRDCDADMVKILKEESGKGAFPAVLHCFTGGRDLAMRAIDLGHYVSFTGILTFKNSQALRDIAHELPADRILVETDAPYLAPLPYRGKRNEPAFVAETAKVLADTPRRVRGRNRAPNHGKFLPAVQQSAARIWRTPHEFDVSPSSAAARRWACRAWPWAGAIAIRTSRKTAAGAALYWLSAPERKAVPASWSTARRICAAIARRRGRLARRRAVHPRTRRPHPRHRRSAAAFRAQAPPRQCLARRSRPRRPCECPLRLLLRNAARQRISADFDRAPAGARPAGRRSTGRAARSRPCRSCKTMAISPRSASASAMSPTRPTSRACPPTA